MDLHLHTNYSTGAASVSEMVSAAIDKKIDVISFTEHVNKTTTWIDKYLVDVNREKKTQESIKIMSGIETKIINFEGELNAKTDVIEKVEFVLAAVHSIPREDGESMTLQQVLNNRHLIPDMYGRLILGALTNPRVSSIAHPGLWLHKNGLPFIPDNLQRDIAREAKKRKKAIEINTKCLLPASFIKLLIDERVSLTIGSDAHSSSEVGYLIEDTMLRLRRAKWHYPNVSEGE